MTNSYSKIVLNDGVISSQHLRIYSIIYDPTIEPFIYAEDLSRNGSFWLCKKGARWRRYIIGKGNAFLLSSGDMIELCDQVIFAFRTIPLLQEAEVKEGLLEWQRSERKVNIHMLWPSIG